MSIPIGKLSTKISLGPENQFQTRGVSEISGRLETLLNRLARDRSPDRITLKVDDRHILIDVATIDCIEVSDKVVVVQTAEQIYRVRETLKGI